MEENNNSAVRFADFFFCKRCKCRGFKYTNNDGTLGIVFAYKEDCNLCMDEKCIIKKADEIERYKSWDEAVLACARHFVVTPLMEDWYKYSGKTTPYKIDE